MLEYTTFITSIVSRRGSGALGSKLPASLVRQGNLALQSKGLQRWARYCLPVIQSTTGASRGLFLASKKK